MFWKIFDIVIWFLWQLPQNILALLMIPFVGKMKLIRFENHCWIFECSRMHDSISLGNFIFLDEQSSKREANILHELGHSMDSKLFNWLYIPLILIPGICWNAFAPKDKKYQFYTERRANKFAKLEVGSNQYGEFIYQKKN